MELVVSDEGDAIPPSTDNGMDLLEAAMGVINEYAVPTLLNPGNAVMDSAMTQSVNAQSAPSASSENSTHDSTYPDTDVNSREG